MPLSPGSRLGAYEITSVIGAGGMGEVYRAHDTKLNRDVAIKVLPELVAADPDRVARFEREAQTLASLNHPNIAQIHGELPTEAGSHGLVMEFVDGEDLAQRIARGRIPLDEAIPIARQIADALEAAHEQGIVHRDLKPANVKVRSDGTVKVLDFGLAKALGEELTTSTNLANSPTFTSPVMHTQMGVILGTAAYMAPEQAKGRAVDRRADVWAFGVVLYEMLTGRRLFDAPDTTEVLAAVLTRTPDWSALPNDTPAAVRRLLSRTLVKESRARLDSMSAAKLDLDEALAVPVPAGPGAELKKKTPAALAVMLLVTGAIVGALGWRSLMRYTAPQTGPGGAVVTSISAANGLVSAFIYGFVLSPDARTLVYAARSADGTRRLWRRRLSDVSAEPIAGTESAESPFFSPDGQQVAFFADGSLKRVPVGGGVAQTICTAVGLFLHGSWGTGDLILFSADDEGWVGVHKVPAAGGSDVLVPLDGPVSHAEWLPDGRHFLYVRQLPSPAQLMVGSIDGKEPPVAVLPLGGFGDRATYQFSPAGFLLFNKTGALMMQRFNLGTLRPEGTAFVVGRTVGTPRGHFAVSGSGTTVAALNTDTSETGGTPGDPICRLEWVDRQGRRLGDVGAPARYWTLRLSPDGSQVASNPDDNVWTTNVGSGLSNRLVKGIGPLWFPDGRQLLYRDETGLLVIQPGGDTQPRRLLTFKDRVLVPTSISPDGTLAVADARPSSAAASLDLFIVSLADGSVRPWLATPAGEVQGAFSPDGQLMAYTSTQTGREEIYVRPFDLHAPATRVSVNGGTHPMWRRDGREIVFVSSTDEMMSVDMSAFRQTGQTPPPRSLFRIIMNDAIRDWFPPYAIAPDGQRFLVEVPEGPEPLTLIQHADALSTGGT
jgi:Tol biopolymer transport system component